VGLGERLAGMQEQAKLAARLDWYSWRLKIEQRTEAAMTENLG
jgi:hypothetical protein